jgi:hypothetical protein
LDWGGSLQEVESTKRERSHCVDGAAHLGLDLFPQMWMVVQTFSALK